MEKADYLVISANCIAGFWYEDVVKKAYEHPFIWSIVKLSDLIYLIKNFDTINFNNVTAKISDGEVVRRDGDKWVKVVVDGKINAYFVHYKENKDLEEDAPKISGTSVVAKNILKYAEETWKRRSLRIPYDKKRVWVFWDDRINTDVDLSEFLSLAKERENEIFVLFTIKEGIEPLSDNAFILPITNYYDVPKHARDLEKILI